MFRFLFISLLILLPIDLSASEVTVSCVTENSKILVPQAGRVRFFDDGISGPYSIIFDADGVIHEDICRGTLLRGIVTNAEITITCSDVPSESTFAVLERGNGEFYLSRTIRDQSGDKLYDLVEEGFCRAQAF